MAKRAGSRMNHAHIKFNRIAGGSHVFIRAAAKATIGEHGNGVRAPPLCAVQSQPHARPSIPHAAIGADFWIEALMSNERCVVVVASQRCTAGNFRDHFGRQIRALHRAEWLIREHGQRARLCRATLVAFKIPCDGSH